ncbi:hypothetical protein K0B03_04570 [Patescibacteria group bacterium]|nr:hypothetical protein [Patescibacteria group bacterium]
MKKLPIIKNSQRVGFMSSKKIDISGKVILMSFWTYPCVQCDRHMPYLREIWNSINHD